MKEAIELLCDKLGMAVDWTAQNVWPQIMEVLARYRIYEIVLDAIGLIMCFICIGVVVAIARHVISDYNMMMENARIRNCEYERRLPASEHTPKTRSIWWYWCGSDVETSGAAIAFFVIGVVLGVTVIIGGIFAIGDLLKWIFIPEVQWIDVITSMTK